MDTVKNMLFIPLLGTMLVTNLCAQDAVQFPEEGAYLSAPQSEQTGLTEFTIECWLMMNGEGTAVNTGRGGVEAIPVLSKGMENDPHVAGLNYFMGIRKEDGVLVFDLESSQISPVPFRNIPVTGYHRLSKNIWYHAAVTYDNNTVKLYLNGRMETAREINVEPATDVSSAHVVGGLADYSGQFYGSFVGKIDEVRVWDYARSHDEINSSINREITATEPGLVTRIGFNEETGSTISAIGIVQHFNWSGTGWERTQGAPFNAMIPPECTDSEILKIGLIADPQYCDCEPFETRIFREAIRKLPVAIDSMNKFQVDFVMNLGDMVDRYFQSYDTIHQIYSNLNMPYFNLLGNHEFEEIHDSLKSMVINRYGMPDYYYDFTFKNWRFLVLDGTELAAYTHSLHPDLAGEADSLMQQVQGKVNDRPWNGGIGRAQQQWMSEQIQSAYEMKQQVILFCHFPLLPDTVYLNLWNNEEIVALIGDHPHIAAYINGHYHPGNYDFRNGIHYVNQTAMLDTYEHNSFSLLEVHSGKLVFKGFGLNPDMVLTYNDHFRTPLEFHLTNTQLNSTHQPGSFVGKFYTSPASPMSYSLYADTVTYKNKLFSIRHDSLFLDSGADIAELTEIPIRVIGMDCSYDTVSTVFTLNYENAVLSNSRTEVVSKMKVYPNPVRGTLYVDLDSRDIDYPFEIIIMDITGNILQRINTGSAGAREGTIEVKIDAGIPAGTYLVKLSRPKQRDVYAKFILQ